MLSPASPSVLDQLWDQFWPATELRPAALAEFINTILFLKQLDEEQPEIEKTVKPADVNENYQWKVFSAFDTHTLYDLFADKQGIFNYVKAHPAYTRVHRFGKEVTPLLPTPTLLAGTIRLVNEVPVPNKSSRTEIIEYLLERAEVKKNDPANTNDALDARHPLGKKAKFTLSRSYLLLLLFFLVAFAGSYFYFRKNNATTHNTETTATGTDTLIVPAAPDDDRGIKSAKTKKKQKRFTKTGGAETKNDSITNGNTKARDIAQTTSNKGLYKIISVAYFHNQPDERTRRNAFVNHWNNSYATLKALDEKNGFIYVVFRNNKNQTSKGWLRKIDLRPAEQ
jgi:hypothetical protein